MVDGNPGTPVLTPSTLLLFCLAAPCPWGCNVLMKVMGNSESPAKPESGLHAQQLCANLIPGPVFTSQTFQNIKWGPTTPNRGVFPGRQAWS